MWKAFGGGDVAAATMLACYTRQNLLLQLLLQAMLDHLRSHKRTGNNYNDYKS